MPSFLFSMSIIRSYFQPFCQTQSLNAAHKNNQRCTHVRTAQGFEGYFDKMTNCSFSKKVSQQIHFRTDRSSKYQRKDVPLPKIS